MKVKDLKGTSFGDPLVFENDENTLEVFLSEEVNRHTGRKFCLEFNGKHESFKSFNGLNNRVNNLCERHRLKLKSESLQDAEDYSRGLINAENSQYHNKP